MSESEPQPTEKLIKTNKEETPVLTTERARAIIAELNTAEDCEILLKACSLEKETIMKKAIRNVWKLR